MKVLITGIAGFIGSSLAGRLAARGDFVVGLDNLNSYYDVNLKKDRLRNLQTQHPSVRVVVGDITDVNCVREVFDRDSFDAVVNLAAQAGVRYSIENPSAYIQANLVGFSHVIEAARHAGVRHFVYASSSSVYGANGKLPFSERDSVDHPISLYAATKKANELIAHSYAHLFRLPCTGLRFFTVYGPWGRPDMALFKFTRAILRGDPIPVFNGGKMVRDFTYIDDIVEGVVRVIDQPAAANPAWDPGKPDPSSSSAPYRVFNIGNNRPEELMRYISVLETCLGRKATIDFLPMQAGDVPATKADVSQLSDAVGFHPSTTIDDGIRAFVSWYKSYYQAV